MDNVTQSENSPMERLKREIKREVELAKGRRDTATNKEARVSYEGQIQMADKILSLITRYL